MQKISLAEVHNTPEASHVLTQDEVTQLIVEFDRLGIDLVGLIKDGKTINETAYSFGDYAPRIVAVIFNILWPERFELIPHE